MHLFFIYGQGHIKHEPATITDTIKYNLVDPDRETEDPEVYFVEQILGTGLLYFGQN